jgi:metal-sulfur cluster biosynthetic enzyme
MITVAVSLEAGVAAALATVVDPELDQPITELGFVRSVRIDDAGVTVHLRLPTSFCAPNFAYLMASDAVDALRRVPEVGTVTVLLDDHHDSDKINAGLAANAGYVGTFGSEAEQDLDELRRTFQRKAHTAAMERCVMAVLRSTSTTVEPPAPAAPPPPGGGGVGGVPRRGPRTASPRRSAGPPPPGTGRPRTRWPRHHGRAWLGP